MQDGQMIFLGIDEVLDLCNTTMINKRLEKTT